MPQIAELKERYSSIADSIDSLIFKTAVLFPLLLLAMLNPLLDFDRKLAELDNDRKQEKVKFDQYYGALKRDYDPLKESVRVSMYTELQDKLPPPPPNPNEIELFASASSLHELTAEVRVKSSDIESRIRNAPKDSICVQGVLEKGLKVNPIIAQRLLQDASAARKGVTCGQAVVEGALNLHSSTTKKFLAYLKTYESVLSTSKEVRSLDSQVGAVRIDRGKIPTPFGNFEIDPRLGLVALAFAAACSYFLFHLRLSGLKSVSRIWRTATHSESLSSWPPPVWMYPLDASQHAACEGTPSDHRKEIAASVILHLLWVALVVVSFSTCFIWNAGEAVAIPGFGAVLHIASLAAIAVAVVLLLKKTLWPFVKLPQPPNLSLHIDPRRRQALLALGAMGFLSLVALLPRRGKRPTNKRTARVSAPQPLSSSLVVNSKTKVVHHAEMCKNHLPQQGNRKTADEKATLHFAYSAAMLESLALDALKANRSDECERLLLKALEVRPLSMRLYDRLVRLYGTLKRYEEIDRLLARGMSEVEAATKAWHENGKIAGTRRESSAALQRLDQEFRSRRERTLKRAKRA